MSLTLGFHKNIDSRTYHNIDAASSHRLGLLKKSPAHLKYSLNNPKEPTEAMKIGEAIHTAILEPQSFHNKYAELPKFDSRTKQGKADKESYLQNIGLRIPLEKDTYRDILNIAIACRSHPLASGLIDAATEIEITGIFKDSKYGVDCKMRADAICSNHSTIFDIKSTLDASPKEFEKSIFNYRYHNQGAFYLDGADILGKKIDHYAIIAIEKEAPYSIAVYRLKNEAIELGRKENLELMQVYAECLKTGQWPGYPEFITDVGLPPWAKKQIERSLVNGN